MKLIWKCLWLGHETNQSSFVASAESSISSAEAQTNEWVELNGSLLEVKLNQQGDTRKNWKIKWKFIYVLQGK